MSQDEKRELTKDDPVHPEVLAQLQQLAEAKQEIAGNLLELDLERLQLLNAARKVQAEYLRIFESCLVERGLDPTLRAEVDSKSGKLILAKEPPKSPA